MENAVFMKKETYFHKCSFCNMFETGDTARSGGIPHFHDYTQIWFVTRGRCEHYVEGQLYLMAAGDTFLIPPKVTHKTVLHPDSSIISCDVALDAVLPPEFSPSRNGYRSYLDMMSVMIFFQDSKDRAPKFVLRAEAREKVGQLMRELLQEYQQELPCYQDMLWVKIQELLLLFIREFMISPSYQTMDALYEKYYDLIENTIRYVDQHYTEPLTLEEVCRISTMSKTYFCYLFKLMTQKTFIEYLTDCRIREALKLLENSNASISEIGDRLGFGDITRFSRTFKKNIGVSPRTYRKLRDSEPKAGRDDPRGGQMSRSNRKK